MAVLGARAAVDFVLPDGIDGSEIFKFDVMRSRKTPAQIVAEAAAVIGSVNQQIADRYGDVIYITEELYGITRQGENARTMTPKAVEYQDSDAVRSDVIGHMLSMEPYTDALAWTQRYLTRASDAQITADVNLIAERWLNRFDYQFITRILTTTENAVGSAGYEVPWAIGTGTNVDYIPPQWRENVFDSTHTHFVYKDDASADYDDLIEAMVVELRHHGYSGNLALMISEDDLDTVMALDRFVETVPPELVLSGLDTSKSFIARGRPFEGFPGELMGWYRSLRGLVEVHYHGRVPQHYCWMTKPMGAGNAANGVALKVDVGQSFGMRPDPELTSSINPKLKQVNFTAEFGIGVNDRLNGVAGYIATGASAYVDPTIS